MMQDNNPGHPKWQIGRALSRFLDATGGGVYALADALDDLVTVAWPFLDKDTREAKYVVPDPHAYDEVYLYARDIKRIARDVLDVLHERNLYGWSSSETGSGAGLQPLRGDTSEEDAVEVET